jgi:uncharacterized coiled-coil DUF342 family protein
MSEDLTKLSGPELAAIIRGAWVVNECTPPLTEALRRLGEDDRVWQRNIERERDLLRAELADTKKEMEWQRESCERLRLRGIEDDDSYDPYQRLCDIVDEECGLQPAKLPVGTMLSMIESALFEWRKRFGCLDAERNELNARIENVRASLGGAEKEVNELSAELAESKRLLGTMAKADIEGARDSERLKHWRKWAEGVRCDVVGTDDEAMDAIGDRCATLNRIEVILGVEGSDEEGAGYEALRKVVSERDTMRAEASSNRRVLLEDVNKAHRENDELRRRLEAEISKPIPAVKIEAGDAYVADLLRDLDHWKSKALGTQAQIDRDDSIAQGMSTAELVAEVKRMREKRDELQGQLLQCRARCEAQRKELHTLNVERKATLTKLEDAQRRVAELEHPETGEHVKGYRDGLQMMARQVEASQKRIAELEEQLSLALVINPPTFGVVCTADSEAVPERDTREEPAERKPHDGRTYGPRGATLEEMEAGACTLHTKDALAHLRELLDERKAIEAMPDRWLSWHLGTLVGVEYVAASKRCAQELREVLNGKR